MTTQEQRLTNALERLTNEARAVFECFEKLTPYEDFELEPGTPHPDGYWNALFRAEEVLRNELETD